MNTFDYRLIDPSASMATILLKLAASSVAYRLRYKVQWSLLMHATGTERRPWFLQIHLVGVRTGSSIPNVEEVKVKDLHNDIPCQSITDFQTRMPFCDSYLVSVLNDEQNDASSTGQIAKDTQPFHSHCTYQSTIHVAMELPLAFTDILLFVAFVASQ